jgi:hypothetical protein
MVGLSEHEEDQLTDNVQRLVANYLADFLAELAPNMPWLAEELAEQGLMGGPRGG